MTFNPRTVVPLDDIKLMLKDINAERRFARLSEWEQNFIANISEKAACNSQLSERQYDVLNRIYEKATENG